MKEYTTPRPAAHDAAPQGAHLFAGFNIVVDPNHAKEASESLTNYLDALQSVLAHLDYSALLDGMDVVDVQATMQCLLSPATAMARAIKEAGV